jgi:hypothetical protein
VAELPELLRRSPPIKRGVTRLQPTFHDSPHDVDLDLGSIAATLMGHFRTKCIAANMLQFLEGRFMLSAAGLRRDKFDTAVIRKFSRYL